MKSEQSTRLETTLTLSRVVERVQAALDRNRKRTGLRPRLAGSVSPSAFVLRFQRPTLFGGGGWPVFRGTFRGNEHGTIIEGTFETPKSYPWMGLAVVSLIAVFLLTRAIANRDAWYAVISAGAVLLLAGAVWLGERLLAAANRHESELLVEELKQALGDDGG